MLSSYSKQVKKSKERGLAFVRLYAAAKQLTTNFPKRFPYLELEVSNIERLGLAPKIIETRNG